MIRTLRRKFILITMIVITCVVLIIAGVINIVNYVRFNNEIQAIIELISNNGGIMPMFDSSDDGDVMKPDDRIPRELENKNLSLETPFKTRYFTVAKTLNGYDVNTDSIFSVTYEDAIDYYNAVSGKSEGYYSNYKYTTIEKDSGTIYIFIDCEQELSSIKLLLITSVIVGLGAIGVIFVLILIFSNVAVRPIAESYDKQKQFITNANHEIKTPLTIISATNEVIEMKYGENEWSETIENQVKRLKDLTDKLVFLSRMEESNNRVIMSNVALSSVIREVAEPFRNLAGTQNKNYEINIEDNIEGVADRELIKEVVSILLDNAFKYTKENDEIEISFVSMGKRKKLTVKNTIDEIEKGDLNCLFERFYRRDKSRNSATGGSGIGLSVAKAIATIHKGKITAKSEDGKSIQFDFTF